MKLNKVSFWEKEGTISFISAIVSIFCGLLVGLIILLVSNPSEALNGFSAILVGSFANGTSGVETMIYMSVPIIMTGLSVGFAYQAGLFNIGASGQFSLGAVTAIWVGIKWTFLPDPIHWLVAILMAMIAGAIWGGIVGFLKARFNVNEVISSIMLNYIGMYTANWMIREYMFDRIKNQSMPVESSANLPKWIFEMINPETKMTVAIIIVLLAVASIYIILNKTTFGFEIKACGKNKDASKYAGINANRNIVMAMVISGALAGIGGALMYLSGTGKYWHVVDMLAMEGFTGIAVALLGANSPIGILFAGLFIQNIKLGGLQMQLSGFVPEVIDIIIAVIIYCGALSLLFRNFIHRSIAKRRNGGKK